jgi:hypothetical protein
MFTENDITEFITTVSDVRISNHALANRLGAKHLRGGKLTKADSQEGAGVPVVAMGFDELGNVCTLCQDGFRRQFIGGKAPINIEKTIENIGQKQSWHTSINMSALKVKAFEKGGEAFLKKAAKMVRADVVYQIHPAARDETQEPLLEDQYECWA